MCETWTGGALCHYPATRARGIEFGFQGSQWRLGNCGVFEVALEWTDLR